MCRVCGQRIEECAACLHFICFSFAKEYGQNITVIKFLKTGEISIEICRNRNFEFSGAIDENY